MVSVSLCINLTHKFITSSQSSHTQCTYKHCENDRREELRLPVPAPSFSLISLQASDNSIISVFLNNRKPFTTAKAPVTEYYLSLLFSLIYWADKSQSTCTVPRGQSLRCTVAKSECRDPMVVVVYFWDFVLFVCLGGFCIVLVFAAILYSSQQFL